MLGSEFDHTLNSYISSCSISMTRSKSRDSSKQVKHYKYSTVFDKKTVSANTLQRGRRPDGRWARPPASLHPRPIQLNSTQLPRKNRPSTVTIGCQHVQTQEHFYLRLIYQVLFTRENSDWCSVIGRFTCYTYSNSRIIV